DLRSWGHIITHCSEIENVVSVQALVKNASPEGNRPGTGISDRRGLGRAAAADRHLTKTVGRGGESNAVGPIRGSGTIKARCKKGGRFIDPDKQVGARTAGRLRAEPYLDFARSSRTQSRPTGTIAHAVPGRDVWVVKNASLEGNRPGTGISDRRRLGRAAAADRHLTKTVGRGGES
ncbi:hypothetical protein ThimaDRAFT_4926, partial [Thiocapsa marina 5811]